MNHYRATWNTYAMLLQMYTYYDIYIYIYIYIYIRRLTIGGIHSDCQQNHSGKMLMEKKLEKKMEKKLKNKMH